MDSQSLKKFAAGAGMFFNRAKQYTEEKLGQSEKTELDAHFENLLQRADKTKMFTERMLKQTEAVIQPNPSHRVEDYLYNTFDKRKPERGTNTEALGQYMIEAGNEFGPGTAYGSSLVKCGHAEQKLGQAERDFVQASANNFLQPLKAFLDGDMKTVGKERKILENKRLDLDAAKNKLRRAKSTNSKDQDDLVAKAEAELRVAQAEFDRQAEITKLLLEGISSTHAHHLRCLNDFVEAQQTYHAQCQQYLADLQRQLGSFSVGASMAGGGCISPTIQPPAFSSLPGDTAPSAPPAGQVNGVPLGGSKARVLYDYDAADMTELSLLADEVITVYKKPGLEPEWVIGERGKQQGKVPLTYLELMD